jgi:hypothetical protein
MLRGVVGLTALGAVLTALSAANGARFDPPAPIDAQPIWSPDDTAIVFASRRSTYEIGRWNRLAFLFPRLPSAR